ncbi:MAG: hypothetical protein IJQ40_02250 [Bacilli bacterium]|nr:hypothetical protein [Bacilli bacterium]MBR0302058.1 hypothetical protein [Bacilli bacterium]
MKIKNLAKFFLFMPMTIALSCCSNNSKTDTSSNTPQPTSSTSKEQYHFLPGPVDVVIVSGQSNGVGISHNNCITRSIGAAAYRKYMNGFENIGIAYDCWTKENKYGKNEYYSQNKCKNLDFVKVMLGQGNGSTTFGPEIGIAEELSESHGNRLFIIKYACGASNLKDDWMEKDSPMYPRFINFIKLQMANLVKHGCEPTLRAFCWMQGEGDAWKTYYENNQYENHLDKFVGNVRSDLAEYTGGNNLVFVDATINEMDGVWDYPKEINDSKRSFAAKSEYNLLIDTQAEGLHTDQEPFDEPDLCHYDTESQVKLGHLFAQAFKPFLS